MTVKSISALENVSFKAKQTESKEKTAIKAENSISDGTKKLLLALGALGTVAAASIAIYKGKGFKLSQIDFNNGVASLKNGEKFTGKIKDNLANGDKIVMEYVDGTLKKSARSGSVNVVKVYETVNGEKIISKSVNGATSTHYITRTQQEVKVEQEKLDKLFKDIAISADDFNVETSKIKYKSAKQKQDILNTIQHKKAIEQEVQTRLRNEQVAIDNAKKAQDAYKKPFEDALSNKSAEKSAEVFKDAHRKMAESEALARLEQEKNLARVQENQDFLIEKMLHPTGKSAKESAEVFNDAGVKSTISSVNPAKRPNASAHRKADDVSLYLDTNGNIETRRILLGNNELWDGVKTIYNKGGKTVTSYKVGTESPQDLKTGVKVYSNNGKKMMLTYREVVDPENGFRKTVEHFDNYSKITVTEGNIETVTLRDKKGNIISEIKNDLTQKPKGSQPPKSSGGTPPTATTLYLADTTMSTKSRIPMFKLLYEEEINIQDLPTCAIKYVLDLISTGKYPKEKINWLVAKIKNGSTTLRNTEDVIKFCENLGFNLRRQVQNTVKTGRFVRTVTPMVQA